MEINKVSHIHLKSERLDSEFYRSSFLNNAEELKRFGAKELKNFCLSINVGFTGELTSVYVESGVGLFRVSDIEGVFLNKGELCYVPFEFHAKNKPSQVKSGDILLAIVGNTIGKVAIVSPNVENAQISRALMRIRVDNSKSDSYFLTTFLYSKYGQLGLLQGTSGSAQPVLNTPLVANCLVPSVNEKAQAYIGDKVRQAERLRARARELENEFREEIQNLYPDVFGAIQETGKHSRIKPAQVNNSLNPGAFNPERLRVRQALLKNGGRLLHQVARIETPVAANYQANDIYIGLDSISPGNSSLSPSTIGKSEVIGAVRQLSEGVILSKLRPYLNKVSYIPPEMAKAYGSTELLCIKAIESKSGWFIYGALKLETTIRQVNPVANGATHPRVSREDVLDLAIVWHEDYETLGEKLKQAQRNYFLSEKLTTAAKYLVEGLIEGKITENELVEAEEALQSGEREPDKAILARLTRKGMDAAHEAALFADLDALYAALEENVSD